MTFHPATIDKLGKLFPRLASDHDGEVVATVRAIIRTLHAAGSSLHELGPALLPKTVDRIVYREKVVYRDRPAPPPPTETPKDKADYIDIPDKAKIARLADILLSECDLHSSAEQFVRHMRQMAVRRAKMRMSVKQKAWWDSLLEEHNVHEEEAA